jgi:radical SAM protein with 4Fe4S-binding SPASM domain
MYAGDGEPLLHPRIADIVLYAHSRGIDSAFTTNGANLSKEFVDKALEFTTWIKVSMNAGNKTVYADIHRTNARDFEKVWENLRYASEKRLTINPNNRPGLGVQSLILPENLNTLEELIIRAKDNGLDYVVLKPYVHNIYMKQAGYQGIDYTKKQYIETLSGLKEKYDDSSFTVVSRLNALSKLMGLEDRYKKCWSTPSLWFYVSGNGDVYACGAHVEKEEFYLGNINIDTIEDIWHSERRKKCLEYVQNDLDLSTCRRTCRMDEPNKYLYDIMERKVPHINFI